MKILKLLALLLLVLPGVLPAAPWADIFPAQFFTKDSQTVNRDAVLGNKIVGIYFGARWCGPCQTFTPHLVNFRNQNANEFEVVFASADTSKSEQLKYMKEKKMPFPAIECKTAAVRNLSSKYGIRGYPTLIIISPKDGSVISTNGRTEVTYNSSSALQTWKDKAGIVDVDPPTISSFIGKSPIFPGEKVTLQWNQTGADQLSLTPGGDLDQNSTSIVVTPTETTTYTLKATNAGGAVSKSIEIKVSEPVIDSFTGKSPIYAGEELTLQWSQTGAAQLHLQPGGEIAVGTNSIKVSPTATTTYTLFATNGSGTATKSLDILVFPPPPKDVWKPLAELPSNSSDIIPFGSKWMYYQPMDGVDPIESDEDFYSTWMMWSGYDGTGFLKSGSDLVGYGKIDYGPLSTYLPAPALGSRYTAYFKKKFSLGKDVEAGFEIFCDDGAVVYLDGVEIARTANFPHPDTYHALADSESDEKVTLAFGTGIIPAGNHTLGVSVHNSNASSYDLAFGMRLFSLVDPTGGNEKFGDWLKGKGLDGLSVEEQGLEADPDRDGMPNLLEYALGKDPLSGKGNDDQGGTVADASGVSLTFIRVKASVDPKLAYRVQYCPKLGTSWSDGVVLTEGAADGVDQTLLPDGKDAATSKFERVKATFVQDPSTPLDKGFLRIQVSQE